MIGTGLSHLILPNLLKDLNVTLPDSCLVPGSDVEVENVFWNW
jgi:hypothetical protein